ncbi:MAG: tyrosine-type recombinase/integrase [Lachnospiraceae bacterium]|nr:tyrosine-type recombinase/integrase [Lachnospiraceae bacterium]
MNKRTLALTKEQYKEIIDTIRSGFLESRPNHKIATALVLEANLGLRISDIVQLRLKDIVKDGERYRLDITEQKTQKKRVFTVPKEIYNYIKQYCIDNEIKSNEVMFPLTERAVQKHLKLVSDYLGYEGIGTHSFRKFFATNVYQDNNCNIVLVQELLQHSDPKITQRYIGISSQDLEAALQKNINLL